MHYEEITTTERIFDEEGRLMSETITETRTPIPESQPVNPWPNTIGEGLRWWEYPNYTWTNQPTVNAADCDDYYVSSTSPYFSSGN